MQALRAFSVLHSSAKQSWSFQISFPARRKKRKREKRYSLSAGCVPQSKIGTIRRVITRINLNIHNPSTRQQATSLAHSAQTSIEDLKSEDLPQLLAEGPLRRAKLIPQSPTEGRHRFFFNHVICGRAHRQRV
jgi:hypothetical protein